jgi:nitrogen regulatory protein P-II 1
MKEIKVFLRPQMLDRVVDALESNPDTPGLTVSEVEGWGHPKGGGPPALTERVKLEIVVPDDWVEAILYLIEDNARTGHPGDGKAFVSTVDEAVRIRTGERGRDAVVPSEHGDDG